MHSLSLCIYIYTYVLSCVHSYKSECVCVFRPVGVCLSPNSTDWHDVVVLSPSILPSSVRSHDQLENTIV